MFENIINLNRTYYITIIKNFTRFNISLIIFIHKIKAKKTLSKCFSDITCLNMINIPQIFMIDKRFINKI